MWEVNKKYKTNFISGYGFYNVCKWSVCNRYDSKFVPDSIEDGDYVFLNLDMFEYFVSFLKQNRPKNKFILITQNSDRDFDEKMFLMISEFTNKIYAINSTTDSINKIPIGFNDQACISLDNILLKEYYPKKCLCYINFKIHHHSDRTYCKSYFNGCEWADKEDTILSLNIFYDKLSNYKYCVCPRGTGIDTHRIYESLLFNVIPIVKKNELNSMYGKMPIILVDDWDVITEDFLNQNYLQNYEKLMIWKEKNKNWVLPEFWLL